MKRLFAGSVLFCMVMSTAARAGPPFLTDDPEPVDYRHFEAYLFSTSDGDRSTSIIDLGGYYKFRPDFSLLFAGGSSVAGEMHTVGYLGLYWTWGPQGPQ